MYYFAGLGIAMSEISTFIILPHYFDKRRPLAIGLVSSGLSVGGLSSAPVVSILLEEYGLSGAYVIVAGIWLHNAIGVAFFRPLQLDNKIRKYNKRKRISNANNSHILETDHGFQDNSDEANSPENVSQASAGCGPDTHRTVKYMELSTERCVSSNEDANEEHTSTDVFLTDISVYPSINTCKKDIQTPDSSIKECIGDIRFSDTTAHTSVATPSNSLNNRCQNDTISDEVSSKTSVAMKHSNSIWSDLLDVSVLKNVEYDVLLILSFFFNIGFFAFYTHYLSRVLHLGIERHSAITLQAAMGLSMGIGRYSVTFIVTIPTVQRELLFGTLILAASVVEMSFPLAQTLVPLLICGILHGLFGGRFSLYGS